jgi:hypothetical protein
MNAMNTRMQKYASFCAAVIAASAAFRTSAGYAGESASPDTHASHTDKTYTYTGTITDFNPREQMMKVQNWTMFHKSFNLGRSCTYVLSGNITGSTNDLRPGEKVTVYYQKVQGVLIAARIQLIPVTFEGKVTMVDPIAHQMVVHQPGLDKPMVIGTGCKVVLLNHQSGSLADIRAGNHATVTYEMPDEIPTARQISQTSIEFTGTVTAIDTVDRTIKAHAAFSNKKFVVANNCSIILDGHPNARLNDLKPDDKLTFSYDEINGVNVLNRIGTPSASPDNVVSTVPPTGY